MEESIQYNIKCHIFFETDKIIQNIISRYNKANSKERQYYSQDILLETKALLRCSEYNSLNSDCLYCHHILRKYIQEYKSIPSLCLSAHMHTRKEENIY